MTDFNAYDDVAREALHDWLDERDLEREPPPDAQDIAESGPITPWPPAEAPDHPPDEIGGA